MRGCVGASQEQAIKIGIESRGSVRGWTCLSCDDLDASGIPSRPFPPFCTHGAQTEQAHSTIAFPQLHAILRLRARQALAQSIAVQAFSLLTLGNVFSSVTSLSIQFFLAIGRSSGRRGLVQLLPSSHTANCESVIMSSYSYSPRAYLDTLDSFLVHRKPESRAAYQ